MLAIRLAKITCVAAVALYMALVAFGNVTDYWTNFAFVTNVLDMNDVQDGAAIRWRAATVAGAASTRLSRDHRDRDRHRRADRVRRLRDAPRAEIGAQTFRRAKDPAIIGLALGFLLVRGRLHRHRRRMVRHVALRRASGAEQSAFRIASPCSAR